MLLLHRKTTIFVLISFGFVSGLPFIGNSSETGDLIRFRQKTGNPLILGEELFAERQKNQSETLPNISKCDVCNKFKIKQKEADEAWSDSKKISIVLMLLVISLVGIIVFSIANVKEDFLLLQTFYYGYMGRKLVFMENAMKSFHNQVEYRNVLFLNYNH